MQNTIIIIIIIIIIMTVEVDLKADQRKITSAHDQALLTKYHATKILQTATEKGNVHVNRCCNFWRQKCDQERS